MTARVMPFAFENLAPAGDPFRGPVQVKLELSAIANNHNHNKNRQRPKVIGCVECIHRSMPKLNNFQGPFRSTKNASRANMALYVLKGVKVGPTEYVDLHETWPRPLHPKAGHHEPRSILIKEVAGWTVVVSHAPQAPGRFPKATNEAIIRARKEWLDVMVKIAKRPGPVLILTDPNGLADELHHRVPKLCVEGEPADAALTNATFVDGTQLPSALNGIQMLTDHKKCLLGKARLPVRK